MPDPTVVEAEIKAAVVRVRTFILGLSATVLVVAGFALCGMWIIHLNGKVREAEAKASAAAQAQARAEKEADLAQKGIGVAHEAEKGAIEAQLRALAQAEAAGKRADGFLAELNRVKKELGSQAQVTVIGQGQSGAINTGPEAKPGEPRECLFYRGDRGVFDLKLAGVEEPKLGTLAVATWAKAFRLQPGAAAPPPGKLFDPGSLALVYEGPVPLDVQYTPPKPVFTPEGPEYGVFAGGTFINGKFYGGIGPSGAFAPWDWWRFRARLALHSTLWPNVFVGASFHLSWRRD